MKNLTKIFALFCILNFAFCISFVHATSYTWTGTTSTAFNVSTNWNPSGVPGSGDNITIVTHDSLPLLDTTRTVKNIIMTSGTLNLNTFTLSATGTSSFNGGTITNGTLQPNGTSTFAGTTIDAILTISAGKVLLNGSTFNYAVTVTDTSSLQHSGTGGNTFNSTVVLTHTSSAAQWSINSTSGNTFNGNATFIQHSTGSNTTVIVSGVGTTYFNGNVIVGGDGKDLNIGSTSGGLTYLASGKTITIDGTTGFSAGTLLLRDFIQQGSTSQSLALTGTGILNLIGCTFNGSVNFTSALSLLIKQNTFNAAATLLKTGGTTSASYGGNTFNSTASVGGMRTATNEGDAYNDDVNITAGMQFSYSSVSTVKGNITISTGVYAEFTAWTGTVKFIGTRSQTVSGNHNDFKNMTIDKDSNDVTMSFYTRIYGTLTLTKGKLITTSTNYLEMYAGSAVSGGNSTSFVSGPMYKTGNTAFVFPTGKGTSYRPIEINAASLSNDAYKAEYFNAEQTNGTSKESALESINLCDYWSLTRTHGSSNVYVTLYWNNKSCFVTQPSYMRVGYWNGSTWQDKGNSANTGNSVSGSVKSTSAQSSFGNFILANATVPYTGAPALGTLVNYSMLAGDSIGSNKAISSSGKVGAFNTISTLIYSNDSILSNNTGSVTSAINDLNTAIAYCTGLHATTISSNLTNQSLAAGVYWINGSATLNGQLNLTGDTNSVYIFNVKDSLIINSNSFINRANVRTGHIFWNINGNLTTNDSSVIYGTFLTKNNISINRSSTGRFSLLSKKDIYFDALENSTISSIGSNNNISLLEFPQEFIPSANPLCNLAVPIGGVGNDNALDLVNDANGDIFVTGSFQGNCDFTSTNASIITLNCAGLGDMFLAKYDNLGNIIWIIQGATQSNGSTVGRSIAVDASYIYVSGTIIGSATFQGAQTITSAGSSYIAKFNKNSGAVLWVTLVPDHIQDISTDGSGNSFVTGFFTGSESFSGIILNSFGGSDIFTAKYDQNGGILWAVKAGGISSDEGGSIVTDLNSNTYITGIATSASMNFGACSTCNYSNSTAPNSDSFISKYNSSGVPQWVVQIGSDNNDFGSDLEYDNSTNIIYYSGFCGLNSTTFHQTNSTNYILTFTNSNLNKYTIYAKINSAGIVQNAIAPTRALIASGGIASSNIAINANGDIYFTAGFSGTISYNGSSYVSVSGSSDLMVGKISNSLSPLTFNQYGSSGNESGNSIQVNSCEQVILTGSYTLPFSFSSTNLSNAVSFDGFVAAIDQQSQPNITPTGPITFCQGGNITLTSSLGCGYLWSNGETTQSILVTISGTYTVSTGCSLNSSSNSVVVTVWPLPNFSITPSGPTTFCQGGNVTLDAGAGYSNYLWSPNASNATTQTINVNASGTYTVTVTDGNGCTGTASENVTVNSLPTPTITPSGPTTFCQGGNVTLDAGAGYSNYLWSPNASNATTQTINVNASGTYTVTVTDGNGCTGTASENVTVNSLPTPTITPSGPTTFCQGGNVTLDAGAGYSNYLWSPNASNATTQTINVNASGTYTVTVTDGNGCTGSTGATVTVNSLPNVSISSNPTPPEFCTGFTVELTANSTSNNITDYLWSNGDQNQTTTVSSGTIYTVTVTDDNGCTASASVSVTENPLPDATITGGTIACDNPNYCVTSVAGQTYVWSVPVGNNIISGQGTNCISVAWANTNNPGSVSVVVTSSAGCISQYTYYLSACCSTFTCTLNNESVSNIPNVCSGLMSNYTISGKQFTVNGILTVDQDLTISNSDIEMGHDAKILVLANNTLHITGTGTSFSHLYACNYMWQSIETEDETAEVIIDHNSLIEDATDAVLALDGGKFTITDSRFNRNLRSIHLYSGDYSNSTITHNEFACPTTLNPPNSTLYSNAHIYLEKGSSLVTIGDIASINSFDNFSDFGIYAIGSTFDAINNDFSNITSLASSSGIWAASSNLTGSDNDFTGCKTGTVITASNADLSSNTYTDCNYGIVSFNCKKKVLTFTGNTFTDPITGGIFNLLNHPSTQTITGNYINISSAPNSVFGIGLLEMAPVTGSIINIETTTIIGAAKGIILGGIADADVKNNNQISLPGTAPVTGTVYAGVELYNCRNVNVKYTFVTSSLQSDETNYGIWVVSSPNSLIQCNHSTGTGIGQLWSGNSQYSYLAGNEMTDCFDHLRLDNNPGLGYQGLPVLPAFPDGISFENKWWDTFLNSNTNATNSSNNGVGTVFYVNSAYPFNPLIHVTGGTGFSSQCTKTILPNWTIINICSLIPPQLTSDIDQALKTANDSVFNAASEINQRWIAKDFLYHKLISDTAVANADSSLMQAKDSLSTANIGKLSAIRDTINSMLSDSIYQVDTLALFAKIDEAQQLNDDLTPDYDPEDYQKIVNGIYLATIARGASAFDSAQEAELRSIAALCPYEYGSAVFEARSLIAFIDLQIVEYDDVCAPDTGNTRLISNSNGIAKIKNAEPLFTGRLFPNPNNGTMNYQFSSAAEITGKFVICDLTGREIINYPVQGKNAQILYIDQRKLSPGVYEYKLLTNTHEEKDKGKLIIIK